MENHKEEYNQWLSSLQVGDEVAYRWGNFWVITTIKSKTPSGRLNLANGITVNNDGSIRGNKYFSIRPSTPEIKQEIWRVRALQKIRNNFNADNLSNEELTIVLKLIKD